MTSPSSRALAELFEGEEFCKMREVSRSLSQYSPHERCEPLRAGTRRFKSELLQNASTANSRLATTDAMHPRLASSVHDGEEFCKSSRGGAK